MTAIAVTIAGSDSGGGAGIQADLKTFSALRVYGASVITALTAQNTQGVQAIHDVPADFIAAQMDSVFSDLKVDAVKIGMLSQVGVIETVAAGIERHGISRVVLDPVMVAASGDRLLSEDAISALRTVLLPPRRHRHPQPARSCGNPRRGRRAGRGDHARSGQAHPRHGPLRRADQGRARFGRREALIS